MSTFNLGLPTDIPWERICFTDDMVHAPICGTKPPPAWRPSIAVFKYEPAVEYQTMLTDKKLKIAYLKIAVTITPDAPDVAVDHIRKFVSRTAVGQVQAAAACYGALLQVSVGPKGAGSASQIYFADFEPKKRELYEAVTDTGQFASGSQTRLAVGKSAMTSDSTESFSSTTAGINLSIPIGEKGSAGGNVSMSGGDRSMQSAQQMDTTNTERSTERRELQSHTTQLSQMYNLFQAFHVGTNRAVFFMEPRPHIVQGEATFINGPRALEGIQEIFLVVVRPESMEDFCVNATLETAHINIEATYFDDAKVETVEFEHTAFPPLGTEPDNSGYDPKTLSWTPPEGWVIDVEATKLETVNIYEDHPGDKTMPGKGLIQTISPTGLLLHGEASWKTESGGLFAGNITHNGTLKFNLRVHLKPAKTSIRQYLDRMYFNVRNLCCCPKIDPNTETPITPDKPVPPCGPSNWWDDFYDPRTGGFTKWPSDDHWGKVRKEVQNGTATPEALRESAEAADAIRKEMLKSLAAPQGTNPCTTPFQQSDIFFTRVVDAIQSDGAVTELDKPLSRTSMLPTDRRNLLVDALGDITINRLIRTNSHQLADILGKPFHETVLMKDQILRSIAPSQRSLALAATVHKVVGVRILSAYPDPLNPRLLVDMSDPRAFQVVSFEDQPNIIDIEFDAKPDDGALDGITVSNNGVAVSTDAFWLSATTARLVVTAALQPGGLYTVRANGTTSPVITFNGEALDGNPIALPSGDGVAGGDFAFVMKVQGPPPVGAATQLPLLKVVGITVESTTLSPGTTRLLARLEGPTQILKVPMTAQPNVITVGFNEQPDAGTVTSSTFTITKNGSPVNATVSVSTNKTASLTITDPLEADGIYTMTLRGKAEPTIKFQGRPIDGEPYALPSGDGIGGGDFTFVMQTFTTSVPSAPALPSSRMRVLGARLMSSSPDPNNPRLITEMLHPAVTQLANGAELCDIIEIDFSEEPDAGTVTTQSLTIGPGTAVLPGAISMPSARTARLTLASPLPSSQQYTVTVKGTGSSPITWNTVALDGDPLALPSGDGIDGGDFTFNVAIAPPVAQSSTLPLIRVKSLRVLSNFLDPQNYEFVTSSFHPSETMQAYEADKPNAIDVEFTVAPDTGTVTATSFTIASSAGTVAHTVAMLNSTTARMTITDPLVAGTTYTITVRGDAPDAVTYQTRGLDGDTYGYPTGDGIEGGNFEVKLKVLA